MRAQFVSGDAFERLGVGPAAGRLLTMQDDQQPGAHPVAVLSHAFWMQRFGGDPGIVGRWFVVHDRQEDRQFQIIGVTEPGFSGVEPGQSHRRVDAVRDAGPVTRSATAGTGRSA